MLKRCPDCGEFLDYRYGCIDCRQCDYYGYEEDTCLKLSESLLSESERKYLESFSKQVCDLEYIQKKVSINNNSSPVESFIDIGFLREVNQSWELENGWIRS